MAQPQLPQGPADASTPGGNVWAEGSVVVATDGATLPPLCIRCGQPSDGALTVRKVAWTNKWPLIGVCVAVGLLGALIGMAMGGGEEADGSVAAAVGVVICLPLSAALRRSATLGYYLCPRHQKMLGTANYVLVGGTGAMIILFAVASCLESRFSSTRNSIASDTLIEVLLVAGAVIFFAGIGTYWKLRRPGIHNRVARIDPPTVRLKKMPLELVNALSQRL